MNKLKTYDEVMTHLRSKADRKTHLLLGNGFSISYDKDIFSYNALHNSIMSNNDEVVKKVFQVLNTQNFELVMQQLDNFRTIAQIFHTPADIVAEVEGAVERLRNKLLETISNIHPDQVFSVPENKSAACAEFLSKYLANGGHIFSTNYDLLLYWILMRNEIENCIDGFGRYAENVDEGKHIKEEDIEWSDLTWGKYKSKQNIHYLHGALPLFDDRSNIIKAESQRGEWLLEAIKSKITNMKYPIFVAAGDSQQKLDHISHNKYLTFCYDKLSEITGSLVVFGFSFGENDKHIIEAINKAAVFRDDGALLSVYIGVYSENDYDHINSIRKAFKCKKLEMFDASTVNIWGDK